MLPPPDVWDAWPEPDGNPCRVDYVFVDDAAMDAETQRRLEATPPGFTSTRKPAHNEPGVTER